MKSKGIKLIKIVKGEKTEGVFNSYDFQLFVKFYDLKQNYKYCRFYKIAKRYGYSIKTVDFIVDEIIKQPANLRKKHMSRFARFAIMIKKVY